MITLDDFEIRMSVPSDASALARLSEQLGYPASVQDIEKRLRLYSQTPDHVVLVAALPDSTVLGWIDVAVTHHLQSGPCAEIGGLVVDECARSRRIGQKLVASAEAWAMKRSLKRIRVRSQVKRTDAHRFYQRENYALVKTSAVFEKHL